MQNLIFILEIIGAVAFAFSGAILGIKKNFDIFGIIMLGVITAVGGGVIRDVIIGATPPAVFSNPVYCIIAVISSLLMCVPRIRHIFNKNKRINNLLMIITDSAGLAAFTVTGIMYAYAVDASNIFLMIFTGVITGVGGGVVRDMISGELPYIFTRHVYACASIAGAAVCALLLRAGFAESAMPLGMAIILIIRFLSAYYRINLPHVHDE